MEIVRDFRSQKNTFFGIGECELNPGKIWKGSKVKSIEIVAKSKCIRSITINDVVEGSKSFRNCEINKLTFKKGEFVEEIRCWIPYIKKSKNPNIIIHHIEFTTNFKRKVFGGVKQLGKKQSSIFIARGRIAQFQTFFKGTGGTLKGVKIRLTDPVEEDKMTPEEEERLNFLIDEMADVPIILKNRELTLSGNLWYIERM